MQSQCRTIWFYVLNVCLALALAGCGDLNQNLTDESAPEKVIFDNQQIEVIGGSDAGNPPISQLVGRTLSGALGVNTDQPDTVVVTDIDGTTYQTLIEPAAGTEFSITVPTDKIYTLTFVKNGQELGQLILDNGNLGLSANYFLVSDLEDKKITLGTITNFVPALQVAAQNDWNQNGVSDYDDATPECSPASLQAQYTTEEWEQMEIDVCYELDPEDRIIIEAKVQKIFQNKSERNNHRSAE